MYEQAEPVRTPQAGSDREHNNKPRAPYPDPPGRRGNTSGHVGPGKQACHRHQEDEDTSSNVYEEAEAVKLENISGDAPHGTDTSIDADTTHPDDARVKSRRVCYITAALAVVGTLVIVGIVLLITINKTYNQQEDIFHISSTLDAFNPGYGQNQTEAMERPNENIGAAQCPLLSNPINGFVTGSNFYGHVLHFTCDEGYRLVGKSSLTCLSDGTWDGQSPTCARSCQEGNGESYRGSVCVTVTGKTCQRWESQTPHRHRYTAVKYPSAGLEQNYCRNPDGEPGVWCYTTDPGKRWELCNVPVCAGINLQNDGCKAGYWLVVGTCFRFSAVKRSYDDARKVCMNEGGTLAMPKTEELDVALRNLVKTIGLNQDYWIGIKDAEPLPFHNRRWQWEDGSYLGNYEAWNPGQPGNPDWNCVQYWSHVTGDPMWDDVVCTDRNRYICQMSAT